MPRGAGPLNANPHFTMKRKSTALLVLVAAVVALFLCGCSKDTKRGFVECKTYVLSNSNPAPVGESFEVFLINGDGNRYNGAASWSVDRNNIILTQQSGTLYPGESLPCTGLAEGLVKLTFIDEFANQLVYAIQVVKEK